VNDSNLRQQVAARIRGLLAGQDGGDTSVAARRLHVDVTSLHMSIDEEAPYPTIDVIAAVIRQYGVDPCWLLTGYYDSLTHRQALGATTDEMPAIVTRMIGLADGHGIQLN
jgi:hypothetical protein